MSTLKIVLILFVSIFIVNFNSKAQNYDYLNYDSSFVKYANSKFIFFDSIKSITIDNNKDSIIPQIRFFSSFFSSIDILSIEYNYIDNKYYCCTYCDVCFDPAPMRKYFLLRRLPVHKSELKYKVVYKKNISTEFAILLQTLFKNAISQVKSEEKKRIILDGNPCYFAIYNEDTLLEATTQSLDENSNARKLVSISKYLISQNENSKVDIITMNDNIEKLIIDLTNKWE